MANTATKKLATANRLRYLITGDGTVALVIANATLLADMVAGPLKDLFNAAYADQAAMRVALFDANVRFLICKRAVVAGVTAEVSDWAADVDTDAVTVAKPEINVQAPDQNGSAAYLDIEFVPTPYH